MPEIDTLNRRFDCIVFNDVIWHVWDPYEFVSWLSRFTDNIIFRQCFRDHNGKYGGFPQHKDFKFSSVIRTIERQGLRKVKVSFMYPQHFYSRTVNEKYFDNRTPSR